MSYRKSFLIALGFVALVGVIVWIAIATQVTNQAYFTSRGLFGQHEVSQLRPQLPKFGWQLHGNYFMGHNSDEVGMYSRVINFAWEPTDGRILYTRLPLAKVVVQFDPTVTTPTVEFDFTHAWLVTSTDYHESDSVINLNEVVSDSTVRQLIVRISPEDYANEPCLKSLE